MGLSTPKRRNKISHDPNNTAWSNSANGYGHKILSAQGWKPGDYLGAEEASHSEHFTAANASHIRILLREDNLGLGAQVGKGNAETFGLSLFSGVLGRLNGKSSAEVEEQQAALRDAKLRTYQSNKHGWMNFVKGGLLVGDTIKPTHNESPRPSKKRGRPDSVDTVTRASKKLKSKSSGGNIVRIENASTEAAEDNSKENPSFACDDSAPSGDPAKQAHKKDKKRRRNPPVEDAVDQIPQRGSATEKIAKKSVRKKSRATQYDEEVSTETTQDDRTTLKQEKRARKEERRKRKEDQSRPDPDGRLTLLQTTESAVGSGQSTPGTMSTSSSTFLGGRHAVRQRYIHQKRLAALDPQAMKEIFMLKASA